MKTPVLLIHFNRPSSTRRQIELLKSVAPERVWVLCDGARPSKASDASKVIEVRQLLDDLPWQCEVRKCYRDTNLGCFRNISEGITWFLDECEAGIIIEDDVLPDPSFFRFAGELLQKYASAEDVFAIAGHNRRSEALPIEQDYGFSNYFECWGWATWKRAWDHLDVDLSAWRDRQSWRSICKRVLPNARARLYWDYMFRQVACNRRDSWAYRYLLTIWKEGGSVLIPNLNLTENIGFTEEGTQTAHFAGLEALSHEQHFPLRHPVGTCVDPVIDHWFEDGVHSKSFVVRSQWLLRKLRNRLND